MTEKRKEYCENIAYTPPRFEKAATIPPLSASEGRRKARSKLASLTEIYK